MFLVILSAGTERERCSFPLTEFHNNLFSKSLHNSVCHSHNQRLQTDASGAQKQVNTDVVRCPERTCIDIRQRGPVWRVTMCREEVSLSHRSLMEQCSFFSVQVHPKWTTSIPHMLCMCACLCAYYITALTLHQLDFKWLTLGVKPSLQ